MGEAKYDVFDLTRLGDLHGGIGGVKTYSGDTITSFCRTARYDALVCGEKGDGSSAIERSNGYVAVWNRIAAGELSLQSIISSNALEDPRDGSAEAIDVQIGALHYLARLVTGGANARIAMSSAPDNPISSSLSEFSLIEYQDGRPGELVMATAPDVHLVMAKEQDTRNLFTKAEENFKTLWEAPSTLSTPKIVVDYILEVAAQLEH
jgi:hypothetical protein